MRLIEQFERKKNDPMKMFIKNKGFQTFINEPITLQQKQKASCRENKETSVTRMIADRIGRHEVLLPVNHNHYNFRKKKDS